MNKPIALKHTKKSEREHKVLIGLVDLFIETGKPVGSATLQEHGFGDLSSATIRNYFSKLEELGFLSQPHTSGGRIPTDLAYKVYAEEAKSSTHAKETIQDHIRSLLSIETKEPAAYLSQATELLSQATGLAAFTSSPRFDQDFIANVKLMNLDVRRLLAVIVTNFGFIQTEVLFAEKKLSTHVLQRFEAYFQWRLSGKHGDQPSLSPDEEVYASNFYHEIMIRYIAQHANFSQSDIYRSGFSNLLAFPELNDPRMLAGTLSLFENRVSLTGLLQGTKELKFFIGQDLEQYSASATHASVISIPYYVGQSIVGAIALLGPTRAPYKKLFTEIQLFSSMISETLTHSLVKLKLKYRQPDAGTFLIEDQQGKDA